MMECYLPESESATMQGHMHGKYAHGFSWIINDTQMRRMSNSIGQHRWNETHVE